MTFEKDTVNAAFLFGAILFAVRRAPTQRPIAGRKVGTTPSFLGQTHMTLRFKLVLVSYPTSLSYAHNTLASFSDARSYLDGPLSLHI